MTVVTVGDGKLTVHMVSDTQGIHSKCAVVAHVTRCTENRNLRFDVTMKNLSIVNVFHSKTHLDKPVQNLTAHSSTFCMSNYIVLE